MKLDCERKVLRPDDHQYWWVCPNCGLTWSERIMGQGWRPFRCPDRAGKFQSGEMSYHKLPED